MRTYQDLLETKVPIIDFVSSTIDDHKNSEDYKNACIAKEYDEQRNTSIMQYQKLLYEMSGQAVPDNYSANHKLCSNFFNIFITQENQYLLGNGISWTKEDTKDRLGKDFDTQVQEAGYNAMIDKVSFGFWNLDHLDVFSFREFVPLWDEEDGSLKAGIRFWQIDSTKPLRATLYELDGYTDFIWRVGKAGEVLHEKRTYKQIAQKSIVDGEQIYDYENYPSFPIVPLWANPKHQSELTGRREQIDAYDLIKSGFANDVDDASLIYWTIQNAGGMDDIDLAKFVKHMRTIKAAVVEDAGARAESHTMDVPFGSREAILTRLRADLYVDFMALDTKEIASGAVTATQIKASYEPLNSKTDLYEYQIRKFIASILALANIDDEPSFSRSTIINAQEEITNLLQSAQYLPEDYVTKKILTIMGDVDKVDDILKQMDLENMERMSLTEDEVE